MEHNEAASAGDWVRFVARVRFGTQVVGGKKISATSIKAVADRLAWYANADGSRGRPGVARLAVDLETTQTTVKNAIAVLRRVGLLRLVKAGGRHGADVYQLIIGADIIEHPDITVWTLGQHTLAVKRQSDKYAGRWTTPEPQTPQGSEIEPEPQTPQGSAIGQESQTPQGSEKGPIATPIADPTGGGKTSTADPSGSQPQTPQGSATAHYRVSNTTAHPDEDHRTQLTVSRARAPEAPQNFPPTNTALDGRQAARAIAAKATRTRRPPDRASPPTTPGPTRRALDGLDNALTQLGLNTDRLTEPT